MIKKLIAKRDYNGDITKIKITEELRKTQKQIAKKKNIDTTKKDWMTKVSMTEIIITRYKEYYDSIKTSEILESWHDNPQYCLHSSNSSQTCRWCLYCKDHAHEKESIYSTRNENVTTADFQAPSSSLNERTKVKVIGNLIDDEDSRDILNIQEEQKLHRKKREAIIKKGQKQQKKDLRRRIEERKQKMREEKQKVRMIIAADKYEGNIEKVHPHDIELYKKNLRIKKKIAKEQYNSDLTQVTADDILRYDEKMNEKKEKHKGPHAHRAKDMHDVNKDKLSHALLHKNM